MPTVRRWDWNRIDNPSYGYWASVARKVSNGKYRMYYSIVITNYIQTGKPEIENNGNFDLVIGPNARLSD